MKYFRRCRSRSRAGRSASRLSTKRGGGPCPSGVTAPGTRSTRRRRARPRAAPRPTPRPRPAARSRSRPRRARARRARDEGDAVAADEDEAGGQAGLRRLGEVDDLRHVRQVVPGEADGVGAPVLEQAEVVAVGLDLEVDDPHCVPGLAGRGGDQLQPQRLEAEEDARVHEPAGMDGEQLHPRAPYAAVPTRGPVGSRPVRLRVKRDRARVVGQFGFWRLAKRIGADASSRRPPPCGRLRARSRRQGSARRTPPRRRKRPYRHIAVAHCSPDTLFAYSLVPARHRHTTDALAVGYRL